MYTTRLTRISNVANILDLCEISLFSARNLALFREVSSLLKTFCISLGKPRRKIQIQPFVYLPYPVGSPRSVIG